jgi:hypothetical protein
VHDDAAKSGDEEAESRNGAQSDTCAISLLRRSAKAFTRAIPGNLKGTSHSFVALINTPRESRSTSGLAERPTARVPPVAFKLHSAGKPNIGALSVLDEWMSYQAIKLIACTVSLAAESDPGGGSMATALSE